MTSYDWSNSQVYHYLTEHMFDGCCFPWPYATTRGYAMIRAPRGSGRITPVRVARLVCELVYGPDLDSKPFARHLCGKGHLGCFNVACLRWGSKQENEDDKKVHGTVLAGEKHNMAKLTWSEVTAIREMAGKYSRYELARWFGVSYEQIRNIQQNRQWKYEI